LLTARQSNFPLSVLKATALTSFDLERQHHEAVALRKETKITDLAEDLAHQTSQRERERREWAIRLTELESELQKESGARKSTIQNTRDTEFRVEQTVSELREKLAKAEARERRAVTDHDDLVSSSRALALDHRTEATHRLALESQVGQLKAANRELERQLNQAQTNLAGAEAALAQR